MMDLKPEQNFDLVIPSCIIGGEGLNKPVDAQPSSNPNQMNRVAGTLLPSGEKVIIAHRPGKGGVDFNKLIGGKALVLAADGVSPVLEKEEKNGKKDQKVEDGRPLFSASGFYLLSSRTYPALHVQTAFTKLRDNGETVLVLTPEQIKAASRQLIADDMDFEIFRSALVAALEDDNNLCAQFDEGTNRRRARGIERARTDAEDAGEPYSGVDFKELAVSHKDGNPFVLLTWRVAGSTEVNTAYVLREETAIDDSIGRIVTRYFSAEDAVSRFFEAGQGAALLEHVSNGASVELSFAQGHVMRTSVSFRRTVTRVNEDPKPYGDGVYIRAALQSWTKGIVALMQSQHPAFPQSDYDAHYYVAFCRQAEVGMNKNAQDKWTPPQATTYDVPKYLLRATQ